ncbi:MAG: winged helix-turn-helix transcriptional regulator [Streptosporangiales bacterium]|nr:winged helix-turn-helix transcriptional regulator [Streptosporangiales bacterium]
MNRRLLALLTDDCRLSVAELARGVGMSAPAVRERLGRLERSGVIRGYRLDVDPAAVGLPVAAWIRVRPGPNQLSKIPDLARQIPEVSECHRITGEDCFLVKAHLPDVEALERIVDQFLSFGQTTSSIVVSTPVAARIPERHPDGVTGR